MPKITHEALVQLIRRAPKLIPSLLWPARRSVRCDRIHVTAAEFVDLNIAERRADVVIAIGGTPGRPAELLVVEIQLRRKRRKRRSWAVYVAGLAARFDCPVTLVVIAPDRGVARWCAQTVDLGHGRCILRPWVLGPDEIPAILDPTRARAAPELAMLSVAAHASDPNAAQVAFAAIAAADRLDHGREIFYIDYIFASLGPDARAALEQLMATSPRPRFHSEFLRKHFDELMAEEKARGKAEGKAEGLAVGLAMGKAEVLLKQLKLKGFRLSPAERRRVLACTDLDTLDTWTARVLTATSVREVLAPA